MARETVSPKCAGLIYGFSPHYIDHLAPLCSLIGVPLIVTEPEIEAAVRSFYPELPVFCLPSLSLPEKVIEAIDILFVCTPRILVDEAFFVAQAFRKKKIQSVWCPHGNSDKGHKSNHMEALNEETNSFVYGEKMIDFLKEKGVFAQIRNLLEVGNYRLSYYQKHTKFYDALFRNRILVKIPPSERTFLYAPTWQDTENSSSFYQGVPHLIENLPQNANLIIKPHPNIITKDETTYRKLVETYSHKKNVLFLENFPTVYPLLARCDVYIGDFSSIGYDFLSFDKPMFFLNDTKREFTEDPGLYLYRCGTEIRPENYPQTYKIMETALPNDRDSFSGIRKTVYAYTFGEDIPPDVLKDKILSYCANVAYDK